MQREMEVIEAKEVSQGGLSQGQQTQIARNQQRIQQVSACPCVYSHIPVIPSNSSGSCSAS